MKKGRNVVQILSIFILEDDLIQAQYLKALVEELCEEQQIPFDFIETTSKPDEILSKIPCCK